MPEPAKIRNVAVVGHRGTGKTSLVEALLFQSGEINRLGTVEAGTTISDSDEDEHKRQLSISMSLSHASWQDRKLNLVDVPGDPSFQGELRCAARVVEGALVTVSGVMGSEVGTARAWRLAEELGLARLLFVNMLDRERADFFRTLEQLRAQLSTQCVAVHIPIGVEHELTGIVDVLHMCAYTSPEGGKEGEPGPIPDELADQVAEYREKLLDSVVETDEGLMERYLEGQELDAHEVAAALKTAVTNGELFPVACGVATKNLGTHALLDLLVEGVPSPAKKGSPIDVDGAGTAAFVFKTVADPFAGRINLFRVLKGTITPETTLVDLRGKSKERLGSLLDLQGKEHHPRARLRGGRHRGGGQAERGADGRSPDGQGGRGRAPRLRLPGARHELRDHPQVEGRRGKGRELDQAARGGGSDTAPPSRSADGRGDPVGDEPDARRGGARACEAPLRRGRRAPPATRPVPGDDPPRGARARPLQEADGRPRAVWRLPHRRVAPDDGYEFVDKIVGGVIPQSYRPAVDKGIQEAMQRGELAGAPVQGVRVELVDGSHHTVDSSEMAFKIAGSMAWKDAYMNADPVLLEPIMELEVTVPDDAVGAVNGDLNSRRGRLQGMEPLGGLTTIRAEVPMSELLTYAQSLTSMTGGRGDYAMHFLRYEDVPAARRAEDHRGDAARARGREGLAVARALTTRGPC